MDELKKKIKKFYIMFGIEAPAAFFLLFLFSYYILKRQFYPSSYLVMSFSIALIAFRQYKGLQHLLKNWQHKNHSKKGTLIQRTRIYAAYPKFANINFRQFYSLTRLDWRKCYWLDRSGRYCSESRVMGSVSLTGSTRLDWLKLFYFRERKLYWWR